MNFIQKIWKQRWILRSFFSTIFFNFYYLPFKQAIHLPILLYKPKFIKLSGQIVINCDKVHFGMVQLGRPMVPIYPNNGIIFQNVNGLISFKGGCRIGSNSAISVNKGAKLEFGENFTATSTIKLVCCKAITFGSQCRLGWDALVLDSSFHPLYDLEKEKFKPSFGAINIGDSNWFANQTVIMHSVTTPKRCIFGLRSIVTRGGNYESYAVHGGNPIKVLSRNVIKDYNNDQITDYGNKEVY